MPLTQQYLPAPVKQVEKRRDLEPLQPPEPSASAKKAATVTAPGAELPRRFAAPQEWKHEPKQEHPMYTTSASVYGRKAPSEHDMPGKFYGLNGRFTSRFGNNGRSVRTTLNMGPVNKRYI